MRVVAVALCGLFLGGCAEKTIEEMGYAERQQLAQEILQRCAALGLKPNSPQMEQCINVEVQKEFNSRHEGKEQARRRAQAIGQGMSSMGQSMQQQSMIAQSRQINCTHTPGYGGRVTTNCY